MGVRTEVVEESVLDSARSSTIACAVGFFFAARLALSMVLVRGVGVEARTGAAAGLVIEIVLVCAVGFYSLGGGGASLKAMLQPAVVRWVIVYLVLSGCSVAWTGAVSKAAAGAYWCEIVADVAMVLMLLHMGPVRPMAHSMLKGYICAACCLAIVCWLMPAQSDLRLGDEDFFNTNQLATVCGFGVFFAQYLMRRKDGKWGVAAAFLTLTLVRSLSKATLAAFVIAEAVMLIQDRLTSRRTKVLLTLTAVAVVLVFWGLFEAYYEVYTSTAYQAETLTGRTAIWGMAWQAALDKPWFGNGLDAMWQNFPLVGSFEPRHAENELLQEFYAFGAAGVGVLIGIYGSLVLQVRRIPHGALRAMSGALLLFTVVRGLAVAEPFDLLLPLWCVVVLGLLVRSEEAVAGVIAPLADTTSRDLPNGSMQPV